MTRDEFFPSYKKLKYAYSFFERGEDDGRAELWYECFKQYDAGEFACMINEWIRTSSTEPDIATILDRVVNCREIHRKELAKKTESAFVCAKCKNKGVIFYVFPNGSEGAEACTCSIAGIKGYDRSYGELHKVPTDDWEGQNLFNLPKDAWQKCKIIARPRKLNQKSFSDAMVYDLEVAT